MQQPTFLKKVQGDREKKKINPKQHVSTVNVRVRCSPERGQNRICWSFAKKKGGKNEEISAKTI